MRVVMFSLFKVCGLKNQLLVCVYSCFRGSKFVGKKNPTACVRVFMFSLFKVCGLKNNSLCACIHIFAVQNLWVKKKPACVRVFMFSLLKVCGLINNCLCACIHIFAVQRLWVQKQLLVCVYSCFRCSKFVG